MWGATTTAQLAARLIAIEEEGLGLPLPTWNGAPTPGEMLAVDDSKLPPQLERVYCAEMLKNTGRQGFEFRITRFRKEYGRLWMTVQDYPV